MRIIEGQEIITGQGAVVPLDAVGEADVRAVGPKAMSLARLARLGLPVPAAFCVAGEAYRLHLNGLSPIVESLLEELDGATDEDRKFILARLRESIVGAPVADAIATEVERAFQELGTGPVAVRSSATAEDLPGHSFAGQHGTYFVDDPSGCLRAVKDCWASLWSKRAYDYRESAGFDHRSVDMAVIVQRLVEADASGVLFTADPVDGRTDRLVVEACFGLGEALVSGKVTPDRFVLASDDLRVLTHEVSRKNLEVVFSAETGSAVERAVELERSESPSIDKETACRLGKLALEAERAFGCPLDMEWAVVGGEVFFLQSRPITALPSWHDQDDRVDRDDRDWADRQIWSNVNTGEIFPDVLTPFTWSVVRMVEDTMGSILARIGIRVGANPIVGMIAGRVYFNVNTMAGILKRFPGLRKMNLTEVLGGEQGKMAESGSISLDDDDLPDVSASLVKTMVKLPGFIRWTFAHAPKHGEAFVLTMREKVAGTRSVDLASLDDRELADFYRQTLENTAECIDSIAFSAGGMYCFTMLKKVCERWLGNGGGESANRLLSGMGEMASAEAGLALWRLAATARSNSRVEQVLIAVDDYESAQKRLSSVEGGTAFLDEFDAFMAEHGHHNRGEIELYNPRWSEMPDYILEVVRGYMGGIDLTDPVANHEERGRESAELVVECRKRLRNPLKRAIFDYYLDRARRGSLVRENAKSVTVAQLAVVRRALLEMGGGYADRGVLSARDDIFFLMKDEVESLIDDRADFDVAEKVAERRAEYEMNRKTTPPAVVVGRFDSSSCTPDELDETLVTFEGLAVSPGLVTGPARVILRSDTTESVNPGEILVAPFTDPGWTPYFIPAAAIVMDMGGLLSHGSIVAREYGIPAVVNVGPATKIIKTGQLIEVDGTRGRVRIIERNPD